MTGWNHNNADWSLRNCEYCREQFSPNSGAHKFCSPKCKGRYRREFGTYQTEAQYELISGRWDKYFSRLCGQKHRKGIINREDCIRILEQQQGRCALSGELLTCKLEKGSRTRTNASLDRKDINGGYAPSNIQLVCSVLNSFRNNTPLDEFVGWCKKVADYDEKT